MSKNPSTRKRAGTSASTGKPSSSSGQPVRKGLHEELGPVARRAGKSISRAFQATAKAAEKTAKVLGLRTRISARQLRIQGIFTKLGEGYFRTQKEGLTPEETARSLQASVDQVDKLQKEIASLKNQEKKLRAAK
jgi:hypothetical protein